MRRKRAIWIGARFTRKGSARTAKALWRLAVRAIGRRRRAGAFVARTAFRRGGEAAGLAALALLAAWAAVEVAGSLEAFFAVACPALCLAAWRSWRLAGRYSAGAASERAVATGLRPLERSGWTVLDDLDKPGGGNVDHLAAGPGGAFTIETKTVRYTEADLRQAFGHARWAERRLRSPVTPVLCLARRHDAPYEDRGVVVCGATELASFLERQPGPPVNTGRVARRLGG
jgi:hypothetical protein